MMYAVVVSEHNGSSSQWNYSRHAMNSRRAENGFAHRNVDADDDESDINVQVKGHDEVPDRSESPVLRPLPSKSFAVRLTSLSRPSVSCQTSFLPTVAMERIFQHSIYLIKSPPSHLALAK